MDCVGKRGEEGRGDGVSSGGAEKVMLKQVGSMPAHSGRGRVGTVRFTKGLMAFSPVDEAKKVGSTNGRKSGRKERDVSRPAGRQEGRHAGRKEVMQ